MYPIIDFGFYGLPTYWLCTIIGILCAEILFLKMAKGRCIARCDVLYSTIYAVIGIIVGAKLLFILTLIPKVIENFSVVKEYPLETLELLLSGYVFYGGLIGGAAAFCIYVKKYKLELRTFADSAIASVPLFHAFGRLGCLLAGCCYGVEYDGPFAITFPYSELNADIAGVPRFPTQICEILFNLIIVLVLIIYLKKPRKAYSSVGLYMILYSVFRFTIEFVRGDSARGIWFGLSTSQWISIPLLVAGIFLLVKKKTNSIVEN